MTNAAIRQQLHQYIDITDDKKAEALYILLQNDIDPQYTCTAEELNMLHERAEKYLKGETKTYTVEESHNRIRQQRKIMKYSLILTADAQQEETDAYNYYENIRAGLGEDLLMELKNSYDKISENPFYYSYLQTSKILRDIKVDRFPYLVIYLVSDNNVTVLSVRNTYRRPFI